MQRAPWLIENKIIQEMYRIMLPTDWNLWRNALTCKVRIK